jgi:DNA-binding LytR/AlgR family response regulator
VIFTTAYDKYLLESFEFNSIDYLLKPITEEKLRRSLDKMKSLERHFLQGNLINLIHQQDQPAKSRIVARKGTEFVVMELSAVAYFYSEHKIVFARDFGGRKLMVDKTLSELEKELDKNRFFRINRKYIAQLPAIDRFKPENGKIRIYLTPEMPEEIHISKETAPFFRTWLGEGQA